MKLPILLLPLLLLASCADRVPRAIIPSPSVVAELNVAPVTAASRDTRDAVREVASAGRSSREAGRKVSEATRRLSESLVRAEELAQANEEILIALADTRRLAAELEQEVTELTAAQAFAQEKERIALEVIDTLESEAALLKENSKAQAVQIRHALTSESTLRKQLEALSLAAEKRLHAERKFSWWRKAAMLTWAALALYLLAKFFGTALLAALRLKL